MAATPANKPDHDAMSAAQGDAGPGPRPVFAGDWNSASGSEKGRHSQRVREWKAEVERVAQSQAGSGFVQPATPIPTGDAATRAVLTGIRDDASAHDSDRIRAAQALIALDREAEQAQGAGPSPLAALRQCLDLLRPDERLAWLQGERIAHLQAEGEVATGGAAEG